MAIFRPLDGVEIRLLPLVVTKILGIHRENILGYSTKNLGPKYPILITIEEIWVLRKSKII